jgi:hypothetical protein
VLLLLLLLLCVCPLQLLYCLPLLPSLLRLLTYSFLALGMALDVRYRLLPLAFALL